LFLYLQPWHTVYVSKTEGDLFFNSSASAEVHNASTTRHQWWYNEPFLAPVNFDTLSQKELTIVTAYFDIGSFEKGAGGGMFSPTLYRKWLTIFAQIRNPVIAYFDNPDHAALMRVMRRQHPKTRIIIVDRRTLWSFQEMQPRIKEIFSQRGYPWNPPNTVVSNYSAAMHAKYELMRWTIRDNPFQSAYICWLDVGLFRELISDSAASSMDESKSFRLALPPHLNSSAIAYSLVYPVSLHGPVSAEWIVKYNSVWVCGCFFIGRVDVMWKWTTEYLRAVEQMVSERWMSTDQQVIYWLFHGEGKAKLKPRTSIQLYRVDDGSNAWFYLGYLSKKAGE